MTPRNPQPSRPLTVTVLDPKAIARIERLTKLLLPRGWPALTQPNLTPNEAPRSYRRGVSAFRAAERLAKGR